MTDINETIEPVDHEHECRKSRKAKRRGEKVKMKVIGLITHVLFAIDAVASMGWFWWYKPTALDALPDLASDVKNRD